MESRRRTRSESFDRPNKSRRRTRSESFDRPNMSDINPSRQGESTDSMEKPTGSPSDESVPDEEDEGWQEKKDRDRESQRKKKDKEDVEALAELMLAMAMGKTQPEEEQPPGQSQAGEEGEMQKHQKKKMKQMIRREMKKSSTHIQLDFVGVPEDGCSLPCEFRLECCHVCTRAWHPYDPEHKEFNCLKPCPKMLCERGHRCRRRFRCHQTCGKCSLPVEKVIPQCQHKQMVPCHKEESLFICQVPCDKVLGCGHACEATCGELCTIHCMVKVAITLWPHPASTLLCLEETDRAPLRGQV